MELKAEIRNFGKIKDAKLQIKDLSVFAGVNKTSKTYATRAIYSVLAAMNTNPQSAYYLSLLGEFSALLSSMRRSLYTRHRGESLAAEKLYATADKFFRKNIAPVQIRLSSDTQVDLLSNMKQEQMESKRALEVICRQGQELLDSIEEIFTGEKQKLNKKGVKSKASTAELAVLEAYCKEIKNYLDNLNSAAALDTQKAVKLGYGNILEENLNYNFQVRSVKELIGSAKDKKASLKIEFEGGEYISFDISPRNGIGNIKAEIQGLAGYFDPLYVPTPFYWIHKELLLGAPMRRVFGPGEFMGGVPKYFYEIIDALKRRKVARAKDQTAIKKLTREIQGVIGGRIIMDPNTDELLFKERGTNSAKPISLYLSATGILQFGMIALLLEQDAIGKGTFLFFDEPEAHLHPDWQEKMMRALYALKDYGVKIVLATHSPVMMQTLGVLAYRKADIEKVALNFFDKGGKIDSVNRAYEAIKDDIVLSLNDVSYKLLYERNGKKYQELSEHLADALN